MSENIIQFPVPKIPEPRPSDGFGLYLRPAYNDHTELLNQGAVGDARYFGVVFNPVWEKRQRELKEQVLKRNLDAILDPKTQQSALPGSYKENFGELEWGVERQHTQMDFQGILGQKLIEKLANYALQNGYTQILAPTHYLNSIDDAWFPLDIKSTIDLRNRLDKIGGGKIEIIYSLAISYPAFRDPSQRALLIEQLKEVPISSLWLKVNSFGARSTAEAVKNFIEGSTELHELDVAVVADSVGGLAGLALLAFGAVGGIVHGVANGERFDARHWFKKQEGDGFGGHQQVYFPALDMMLKKDHARALLEATPTARSMFGCRDTNCCKRGVVDMLDSKAHHFLYQRTQDIEEIGRTPQHIRPKQFINRYLHPVANQAMLAANFNWKDNEMSKKTTNNRKRLDLLQSALEKIPTRSFSLQPKARVARG